MLKMRDKYFEDYSDTFFIYITKTKGVSNLKTKQQMKKIKKLKLNENCQYSYLSI